MKKEQINYEELERVKKMLHDMIPTHIKEVVDYYKPNITLAHDDRITIFVLYVDKPRSLRAYLLGWVVGVYEELDDAINYNIIYDELDRQGLIDEYNKVKGGQVR